jgi:O-acetyl-ADP-ribose deacetylase (regulator of RNase III)
VSLQVLAERLIKSAMEMKNGVEVVFVTFGDHDTQLVKDASQRLQSPFVVRNGSITQFALHQCPLIVNAANMEGVIGGGVAFAIGSGSGNISALDREALEIRAAFYGIDVRKAHNYSSNLQAAFQIGAFMKRFLSL